MSPLMSSSSVVIFVRTPNGFPGHSKWFLPEVGALAVHASAVTEIPAVVNGNPPVGIPPPRELERIPRDQVNRVWRDLGEHRSKRLQIPNRTRVVIDDGLAYVLPGKSVSVIRRPHRHRRNSNYSNPSILRHESTGLIEEGPLLPSRAEHCTHRIRHFGSLAHTITFDGAPPPYSALLRRRSASYELRRGVRRCAAGSRPAFMCQLRAGVRLHGDGIWLDPRPVRERPYDFLMSSDFARTVDVAGAGPP
jgi:hypothetical protein